MGTIYDTFMINGAGTELDMLECRIRELEPVKNLVHVAVEADVDHQNHPKPFILTENLDRFDQWSDRLIVVRATGLPTADEAPDPWAREQAQREHLWTGLRAAEADADDVVLHGDLDEIPTVLAARNVNPAGTVVSLRQRWFNFAVDWQHPEPWYGTVAVRVGRIRSFAALRDARNRAQPVPKQPDLFYGWHLSWLGGQKAALDKLGAFCHPEIAEWTLDKLHDDFFMVEGWHVDGTKMHPVDVDGTWPKWIAERRCPDSWFRPR